MRTALNNIVSVYTILIYNVLCYDILMLNKEYIIICNHRYTGDQSLLLSWLLFILTILCKKFCFKENMKSDILKFLKLFWKELIGYHLYIYIYIYLNQWNVLHNVVVSFPYAATGAPPYQKYMKQKNI